MIRYSYDEEYDILRIRLNDNPYDYSDVQGPIILDYDTGGNLCGIQVCDTKNLLREHSLSPITKQEKGVGVSIVAAKAKKKDEKKRK